MALTAKCEQAGSENVEEIIEARCQRELTPFKWHIFKNISEQAEDFHTDSF